VTKGAAVAQSITEVMTKDPICLSATTPVSQAARAMRDRDVGDVIVLGEGDDAVQGILTDRDITIRVVADGADPESVTIDEVCTKDMTALSTNDTVEDAVRMMREKAIRRIPILEGGRPVGIVSIGDLAVARDSESALADISASKPDR
jgi:signal-transduction protein with cAMP-binding, CBS, and nucleotidyltransferase domain